MQKLCEQTLSKTQLEQAKRQFNGQLSMSEENKLNIMLMLGKNTAQKYPIESLEEVIHKINEISAEELQSVAKEIFDVDKLSYLAYVSD
jgi:predicted Zn-dependent peptidase